MTTCKADTFTNYKVPTEDHAAIAGRSLSVRMTCLCAEAKHMNYVQLAQDTGDPAVIAAIGALVEALAAAKDAVQAYVRNGRG